MDAGTTEHTAPHGGKPARAETTGECKEGKEGRRGGGEGGGESGYDGEGSGDGDRRGEILDALHVGASAAVARGGAGSGAPGSGDGASGIGMVHIPGVQLNPDENKRLLKSAFINQQFGSEWGLEALRTAEPALVESAKPLYEAEMKKRIAAADFERALLERKRKLIEEGKMDDYVIAGRVLYRLAPCFFWVLMMRGSQDLGPIVDVKRSRPNSQ